MNMNYQGIEPEMNEISEYFSKIYKYRFKQINQNDKILVWNEISKYIYKFMGNPAKILDPAGGSLEFIRGLPDCEKWVVDIVKYTDEDKILNIKYIVSDIFTAKLPENYFSGIFISNFLEHLSSQAQIRDFLMKMYKHLEPGGKIVIMGPNFKYTYSNYFDFADHNVPLTEKSIEEHLVGCNFKISKSYSKFLPFSFSGILPAHPILTRLYLSIPITWKFLGKQFLVMGQK